MKIYKTCNEMLRLYLGGYKEQLSHTLSDWVGILNNAKKYYFLFKCFYIWQTCTFIVYLYDYAVTITVLN